MQASFSHQALPMNTLAHLFVSPTGHPFIVHCINISLKPTKVCTITNAENGVTLLVNLDAIILLGTSKQIAPVLYHCLFLDSKV